ncbi:MAG: histidinol-phosphatase HisJ family protein [Solirubrobacteraceae bacterium]|nr:histidinol-phosphatase HisJ family protein [Solirubrobacteraceae bacterium]
MSDARDAVAGQAEGLPGDYHVHTTYSDGTGTVAECVAQAVSAGLAEIGIADHFSPVVEAPWNIRHARLDDYVRSIMEAASGRADVTVLLGLEADYVPEHEAQLRGFLADRRFDYVIAGVHQVDGFEFDDPDQRDGPRWQDPDALLRRYYEVVAGAAASGCFDVIAHLDWIGLWGHVPGPGVRSAIEAALDAIATSGSALELNTDRTSDPAGVMYPSDELLAAARARGIPLVISSDAHEAAHVGRFWDEAIVKARRAGYRETLRLSDRQLVPLSAGP